MTRKGEQTRERILSTASELVVKNGFASTSIRDLVQASGVNRGSLYFHFPGKDDLGVAVLERGRQRFLEFVRTSLRGDSPGERLDNFFESALKTQSSTGFVGGCLWGNTALEMSDSEEHERYIEVVRSVFEGWICLIEEVIEHAQGCGQVRDDIPAETLARQVVATMEGGIMFSRLAHDPGPFRNCLDCMRTMLELRTSSSAASERSRNGEQQSDKETKGS